MNEQFLLSTLSSWIAVCLPIQFSKVGVSVAVKEGKMKQVVFFLRESAPKMGSFGRIALLFLF